MPKCVCTYLQLTTREMVEMSSPVFSAMLRRTIGLSRVSSPSMK